MAGGTSIGASTETSKFSQLKLAKSLDKALVLVDEIDIDPSYSADDIADFLYHLKLRLATTGKAEVAQKLLKAFWEKSKDPEAFAKLLFCKGMERRIAVHVHEWGQFPVIIHALESLNLKDQMRFMLTMLEQAEWNYVARVDRRAMVEDLIEIMKLGDDAFSDSLRKILVWAASEADKGELALLRGVMDILEEVEAIF